MQTSLMSECDSNNYNSSTLHLYNMETLQSTFTLSPYVIEYLDLNFYTHSDLSVNSDDRRQLPGMLY